MPGKMKKISARVRVCLLLALALAAVSVDGWADKIILKNGGVIEGLILRENDREIAIMARVGELTLPKDTIREIHKGNSFQVYLDRGEQFVRQKRFLTAQENYERAERAGCPQDVLQKHLDALDIAERSENNRQIEKQLDGASKLRVRGMLDSAIETLTKLPPEQKADSRVKKLLSEMLCGSAYEHIDHFRYNEAVKQMILARDLGAPKAELHYLMGILKRSEGRVALAQYEFEEALQADPSVYTRFPGSISAPLFPVPIEIRADAAMLASATLELTAPKIESGLDKQIALKGPLVDIEKPTFLDFCSAALAKGVG